MKAKGKKEKCMFYLCIQDARSYGWELPPQENISHNWEALREAVQNHIKSVNWVTRVELRDKYGFT